MPRVGFTPSFCTGYDVNLIELLNHDEDALAHLLSQQRQLNVGLVLVSVADDERVAVTLHGDDGVQLRLAAGLQSEVELASVGDDFLHDGLHLVYLDGVDDVALALVVILLGSLLEARCGLLDAVVENVGEAKEHRRGDVAQLQFIYYLTQIGRLAVLEGRDTHVAFLVDREVRGAPAVDVVELLRVFNSPLFQINKLANKRINEFLAALFRKCYRVPSERINEL